MHHLYGILTDENAEHVAHSQEGRFREGRVQRPILVQFRARRQVMLRDERLGEVGRVVNVAVTADHCGRGNGESFRVRDGFRWKEVDIPDSKKFPAAARGNVIRKDSQKEFLLCLVRHWNVT